MDNWDDYRFFLAVAESGSLSGAARALGVTQPTVGRRIKDLETRLHARLFDHLSHGYVLTPAGESILDLAGRLDLTARAIEQQVSGEDAELSGAVRLTSAEGISAHWLAPKMAAFRERYPDIEVELIVGVAALNLLRREADVALRVGNPRSDELVGRRIGHAHFGLYAAESYLAARDEPRTPADLRHHAVIESVHEIAELQQVQKLRALAKGAPVAMRSNNLQAQMAAARRGVGLIALPCYMVQEAPELRRVLPDDFDMSIDLWLLTHRELRQTVRIRAVLDFLAEEVQRDALMLSGEA